MTFLSRMLAITRGYRGLLSIAVAGSVFYTALSVLPAIIIRQMLTVLAHPSPAGTLVWLGLAMVGATALMAVSRYLEGVDQVRPEPPLTGVALTLIREAPLLDTRPLRDQRRRAQELRLVRIAFVEDPGRQAVRREHHHHPFGFAKPGSDRAHIVGHRLEIAVQVVPAVDEVEAKRRR